MRLGSGAAGAAARLLSAGADGGANLSSTSPASAANVTQTSSMTTAVGGAPSPSPSRRMPAVTLSVAGAEVTASPWTVVPSAIAAAKLLGRGRRRAPAAEVARRIRTSAAVVAAFKPSESALKSTGTANAAQGRPSGGVAATGAVASRRTESGQSGGLASSGCRTADSATANSNRQSSGPSTEPANVPAPQAVVTATATPDASSATDSGSAASVAAVRVAPARQSQSSARSKLLEKARLARNSVSSK